MDQTKKDHCMRRSTRAIHAGQLDRTMFGEVSVPIFQSSTFSFPDVKAGAARFSGEEDGFIYTRIGNPTIQALERTVTDLEGGWRGLATASGMAAIHATFLALLDRDAHVVCTDAVYGPTRVMLETIFARFGVEAALVDTTDLARVREAMRPNTRLVLVETPANPTLTVTDLRAVAEITHPHGAILAVDNTFASPYLQRPFEHGADLVIHSLTKFINGHSDVVGGMIVTKDEALYNRIRPVLITAGGTMDPHQAWLIQRGVRTLPLRMERGQENAARLADFLRTHPKVAWVRYPGLPDHPQHDIVRRQMDGAGAMLCFGVEDGYEGGKWVMNHVQVFTLAVSLGGVESLIEHPASMTHASVPRAEREQAGILDELIRVAVGCEDYEDLRDDLDQALCSIPKTVATGKPSGV